MRAIHRYGDSISATALPLSIHLYGLCNGRAEAFQNDAAARFAADHEDVDMCRRVHHPEQVAVRQVQYPPPVGRRLIVLKEPVLDEPGPDPDVIHDELLGPFLADAVPGDGRGVVRAEQNVQVCRVKAVAGFMA
jgi:hypothetical protein